MSAIAVVTARPVIVLYKHGGVILDSKMKRTRLDLNLTRQAADVLEGPLEANRANLYVQSSLSRLLDAFERSPSEFTQKLSDNLRAVRAPKGAGEIVKRITVAVPEEDLTRLDQVASQLRARAGKVGRQDLIRLSLLLWPSLVQEKVSRHRRR